MPVILPPHKSWVLRTPLFVFISKMEWWWGMWLMVTTFLFNVVICTYLYNNLFFPPPIAIAPLSRTVNTPVGPATQEFMKNLTVSGHDPVSRLDIKRRYFSGSGRIITLNNDNLQTFEYAQPGVAPIEMSLLAQRYADSSRSPAWKKNIHIYTNEHIAVFYMGTNEKIIHSLEFSSGLARVDAPTPAKTLTKNNK